MAYILAARSPGDHREHYWCGGMAWSPHPSEAAQFNTHADALSTLPLIASIEGLETWKLDAEPVRWPADELPETPEFID